MLYELLQPYTEEELHQQPSSNQWSLAQIMSHLLYVERGSLSYCRKKLLAGDDLEDVTLISQLKFRIYRTVLYSKLKIKAPEVVAHPSNEKSFEELKQVFDRTRKEMEVFIDEFPDKYLDKGIFRHPLGGRIGLQDWVQFIDAHLLHHLHQVKRTMRSIT